MKSPSIDIIAAMEDPNVFRAFFGDDIESWVIWQIALRVMYGIPLERWEWATVRRCMGRDAALLPVTGFEVALLLTGRRSGKSRIAALIGAFEAVLAGHEKKLARGERGLVVIVAPTKAQATIVQNYLRAIFDTLLLREEVIAETRDGFDLKNGISVQVLAGDWRTVRGFTLVCAIIDEVCFLGLEAESNIRSDTELIRALRPGLATSRGKLIAISSPHAKRGWSFDTFKKNHGNDTGKVMVWVAPSRRMNSTLPQSVVDAAMEEDLAAAKSEYLGEWRDDIAAYLPRSVIEELVVKGRFELPPKYGGRYFAFADLSGGRVDDAALSIGHRNERKVVVDLLARYRPPFNPYEIVGKMAEELKRFGVRRVVGDNYAADFVSRAFEGQGIGFTKSEKPRSALYLELLPRLCSREIELPDNDVLVTQLASLERRTRSGGRDIIDHPPGGHDDLANVVAGVADAVAVKRIRIGAFP